MLFFGSNMLLTQYGGAIVGPIAKLLGYVIQGIYNFFGLFGIENAALCIILFTVFVRVLMIPLNIKQQKATKLSSRMNPELMKIQDKYKGKTDQASQIKMQTETQAVYEKYGANPLSGCLPMLISFPIMIALYRIIYNIPAYIPEIYDIYAEIANAIEGVGGNYVETLSGLATGANALKIGESGVPTINAIIDMLATFTPAKWVELENAFPTIADVIQTHSQHILHINDFFGIFNITDTPKITSITVLVPILAAGLQWYQGKQISAGQPPADPNNQAAAMTKGMNTFMPIMSGMFCLMLPIGIGLYWITGSVCAIVQQFFVNKYFDKVDVDELIKKNQMKALKKREKRGEDVSASMRELAKTSTKSIQVKDEEKTEKKPVEKKEYKASNYTRSEVSYKAGSIAANANILKNREGKGEKKND